MDSTDIFAVDDRIADFHGYWEKNRAVIAGSRVISKTAQLYLTREIDMNDVDFRNYVKRVYFHPAAQTTHDGLMGLMFRAPPKIKVPDSLADVLETITSQGFTLEDLAEDLASERLITNYTALVTDYPVAPAGMSLAKAVDQGFRPFIAMYRAESILGIELGVIGNRQRVVRVRLLDDDDTVRELRLDGGVYSITIHRKTPNGIVVEAPIIPTRAGVPLDEIPFTLDSSSRDFMPVNSRLGELCELNVNHYVASANLATEMYYSTFRIHITKGLKAADAAKLAFYQGVRWNFESKPDETSAEWSSPDSNVIAELRSVLEDVEKKMAAIGLRILESDKPANIAAETERIRDNAQNASLAGLTRRGDRVINDQLAWVCYWLNIPEDSMSYETPTDFGAQPMSSTDMQARVALWQSGAISLETLLTMLSSELPEHFDPEKDRDLRNQEVADKPTSAIDPEMQAQLRDGL